jgi:septum formation protein
MAIPETAPQKNVAAPAIAQPATYHGAVSLILASSSPRRADLLRAAAIPFDIQPADIDETRTADEHPEAYVRRVAKAKAGAVGGRFPARIVLAADTAVVVGPDVLGKPVDGADAARMLGLLSGRVHEVMTAVCLLTPAGPETERRLQTAVESTRVTFARLSEAEIAWYVASGEPADKAGAYAIQGLASRFVTRIEGSYSNVVGLPIERVYQMCTAAGMLVS